MRDHSHSTLARLGLLLVLTAGTVIAGCAAGAPPGFSSGENWSIPLVGPLENGTLVVPVRIKGKGPYLFIVDTDAPLSSVDEAIVSSLQLHARFQSREVADESDTNRQVVIAEVPLIELGDLRVRNKRWRVHPTGQLWFGGRMIHGLLGRDIVAESLIFTVDRDRGMAYLATQGHQQPPPEAIKVPLRRWMNRFVAKATVNQSKKVELHVDFGGPWSQLWPELIKKSNLPTMRARARTVDELAIQREVRSAAIVAKLQVSDREVNGIMVLPFADKRVRETDFDGTLGQNVLSHFRLTMNWHHKELWLAPRASHPAELTAERIRRWGPDMDRCGSPACVTVAMRRAAIPPAAEPPPVPDEPAPATAEPAPAEPPPAVAEAPSATAEPPPAPVEPTPATAEPVPAEPPLAPDELGPLTAIEITREEWTKEIAYDVFLEPIDAQGAATGAPLLQVAFHPGTTQLAITAELDDYASAAGFQVLDVSPYPPDCGKPSTPPTCVWKFARPR